MSKRRATHKGKAGDACGIGIKMNMQNQQKAELYTDILHCEMPWKEKTEKRENEIDTIKIIKYIKKYNNMNH